MRFWISKPEPFVVMNPLMMTEKNKNQWIYQLICDIQIIWKLSYINVPRIIVFELFEHWFTSIVFLFPVLIISIWITMKPNNLRKFYYRVSEKHKPLCLWKGSYKFSPVRLFTCLSVRLTHFFQDLPSGFS